MAWFSSAEIRRSVPGGLPRRGLAAAAALCLAATLTACGSDDESSEPAAGGDDTQSVASVEIAGVTVSTDADLAAQVPAAIKDKGVLSAIQYDNAPADTFVEDGEVVGWGPELGEAVATLLGLTWEPQASGAFDTFIPGLQNGRFLTTWASLTVLPERLEVVDIVAVHEGSTGVIVKKGSDLDVAEPTDLCNLTVAALAGSSFITQLEGLEADCATAGLDAPTIAAFPQQAAAQLAVVNGRVDAFASTKGQLAWLLRQDDKFDLEALDFMPTLEGIGVSKESGMTEVIAAAVDQLIADGTYEAIMTEWDVDFGLLEKSEINPS